MNGQPKPTRVVYIVIDGMSTEAFELATASGRAPALAAIKERAGYVRDSVAVFPTITPCASASLVTGAEPHEHRIPGMCWYDRDARRFVNYGQNPRVAVIEGLSQIVRDVLVNLNQQHLSVDVETIHESLDRMGLVSSSINFMVFRGPVRRELHPNLLERLLFRKHLPDSISGPAEHYFADVVDGRRKACTRLISKRGLAKRIQATDAWASCVTRELLQAEAADMILFYLHENDHRSHRNGPHAQTESLAQADRHVGHVLEACGSWEETLDRVGFVVTADHSQSPVASDPDHIVRLEEVLDEFEQVEPSRGKEPLESRDIACAGNGRVGFIYLNAARRERLLEPVRRALRAEPAIDQLLWRDRSDYVVWSERGTLRFRRAQGTGRVEDERGNHWEIDGDPAAVGGVVEDGRIRTAEYPLALWRAASALDLERCGDLVVTARLGYDFTDLAGADHRGGGDHGSLHVQDSIVPFLSTLSDPPLHPSTIDAAPHIRQHFERAAAG